MQSCDTLNELASIELDVLAERARAFIAMRAKGDFKGMRSLLSPVVAYNAPGAAEHRRQAQRVEGIEAVEARLQHGHREFESLLSRIDDLVQQGERVIVRRTARLRHRGTSAFGTMFVIDFFRFRDGLIVELAEYTDTAALERLNSGLPPI